MSHWHTIVGGHITIIAHTWRRWRPGEWGPLVDWKMSSNLEKRIADRQKKSLSPGPWEKNKTVTTLFKKSAQRVVRRGDLGCNDNGCCCCCCCCCCGYCKGERRGLDAQMIIIVHNLEISWIKLKWGDLFLIEVTRVILDLWFRMIS